MSVNLLKVKSLQNGFPIFSSEPNTAYMWKENAKSYAEKIKNDKWTFQPSIKYFTRKYANKYLQQIISASLSRNTIVILSPVLWFQYCQSFSVQLSAVYMYIWQHGVRILLNYHGLSGQNEESNLGTIRIKFHSRSIKYLNFLNSSTKNIYHLLF